ncbi:MAG: hypothetical protein QF676_00650 [Dehalococcoidia bacterium]|jgi:hypothetical protein|nr:hypothetical protein [Chloroflexota bacterium]MDP6057014.1 hypothetical protein [Dehalococcoidia bacterium]MDP7261106.1 hypothetical protein [Dehalococcoidia bacterium]|tara:strand:+ start:9085 stop:9327 length:243 start_codon:yes stop_codon:yes gene_type:complete
MSKKEFPPPPHYPLINTQMMTARELRETLDDLWDWVHDAEMVHEDVAPPDNLIQDVRHQMATIIEERVERHSDETSRGTE